MIGGVVVEGAAEQDGGGGYGGGKHRDRRCVAQKGSRQHTLDGVGGGRKDPW